METAASRQIGPGQHKYLTFQLAGEIFGIDIRMIREIIGIMEITPVPDSDASIRGVINLRGKIIPVVDLRLKFGVEAAPFTERTCIVVVDLPDQTGLRQVGTIVDAVSEVSQIPSSDIEPPPEIGSGSVSEQIVGMAKLKEKVVILLDIGNILGG
ncbi:MAG TPA: chemotaxis protein CheW [Candidatus Deferrimicrobiaceae bacterium]|jgi:purine-binding chemotaxis protein CheW